MKRIRVVLSEQIVEAFNGSAIDPTFDCVSGDEEHRTDAGRFHIFARYAKYTSKKYGVPMNYAMFFTKDGKALHQYHGLLPLSWVRVMRRQVSDWFGSRGCVRLSEDDARTLFEWTPHGTLGASGGRPPRWRGRRRSRRGRP